MQARRVCLAVQSADADAMLATRSCDLFGSTRCSRPPPCVVRGNARCSCRSCRSQRFSPFLIVKFFATIVRHRSPPCPTKLRRPILTSHPPHPRHPLQCQCLQRQHHVTTNRLRRCATASTTLQLMQRWRQSKRLQTRAVLA
jgi:hypothetical protein